MTPTGCTTGWQCDTLQMASCSKICSRFASKCSRPWRMWSNGFHRWRIYGKSSSGRLQAVCTDSAGRFKVPVVAVVPKTQLPSRHRFHWHHSLPNRDLSPRGITVCWPTLLGGPPTVVIRGLTNGIMPPYMPSLSPAADVGHSFQRPLGFYSAPEITSHHSESVGLAAALQLCLSGTLKHGLASGPRENN